jgi:hypothetical protein
MSSPTSRVSIFGFSPRYKTNVTNLDIHKRKLYNDPSSEDKMSQKKKKPMAICLHNSNAKGIHHFKINLNYFKRKDCTPLLFLFTCQKEKKSYCLIHQWINGFKKEFSGKGAYFSLTLDSKKDMFSYKGYKLELKNKYWRGDALINRSINEIKRICNRIRGTNLYITPRPKKSK